MKREIPAGWVEVRPGVFEKPGTPGSWKLNPDFNQAGTFPIGHYQDLREIRVGPEPKIIVDSSEKLE